MKINLYKCVKIFGFGDLQQMKGKVCCHLYDLPVIHNYFKELFINGKLFGSVVIHRSTLTYQHFALDFDLKHINCSSYKQLNIEDYKDFIKNKDFCNERYMLNNYYKENDDTNYNTNNIIYVIFFLFN